MGNFRAASSFAPPILVPSGSGPEVTISGGVSVVALMMVAYEKVQI